MTDRWNIPLLGKEVETINGRLNKIEESQRYIGRLIIGSTATIIVAIAIATLTRAFWG